MRFEFKMIPGKTVVKEPPQRPNVFELLKTGEKQKEIISSTPVLTDAFGRTLYQTPNGQFRAIGDIFNLVANVYQTQNNYVTLAPPPDDGEEDTMPKEKPKKQVGGLVIPIPTPPPKFDFIYFAYSGASTYIYKTDVNTATTKRIFSYPEGADPWWAGNGLAMGFHEKTAIALGLDAEYESRLYQIGYENNIIKSIILDPPMFNTAKFTIYNGNVYFAAYKDENVTGAYSLSKDLEIEEIRTYPKSVYDVEIWKNYIAYILENTFYVYDYINNETICELNIEYASGAIMTLVDFSNDHACFVVTFNDYSGQQYVSYHFCTSYFINLKSSGEYKVWEQNGINGWMASAGEKTFIMYYPHYFYLASAIQANTVFRINNIPYIAGGTTICFQAGNKWKATHQINRDSINCSINLSNSTAIIGTTWSYPYTTNGGRIFKYQSGVWVEKGRLGTARTVLSFALGTGAIFAGTSGETETGYSIYRSLDDGENWNRVLYDVPIHTVHPAHGMVIYGTGAIPLWRSTDNGANWEEYTPQEAYLEWDDELGSYVTKYRDLSSFWAIKKYYGDLIGLVGGTTVFHSADNGKIWRKRYQFGFAVNDLAVMDGIIFTTSYMALYKSADGGNSFSKVIDLPTYKTPRSLVKIGSDIYFSTQDSRGTGYGGELYRSTDNGNSFSSVDRSTFKDYVIELYHDDILTKTTHIELSIIDPQGQVANSAYTARAYQGELWFMGATYKYNPSTGEVTFEDKGSGTNFIWIGDFIYYVRWDNEISNYSTFARNMKTNEEIRIIKGRQPYFFPEHLATYILR